MMNSYCILDPTRPEPRFAGKCALAVMAKAPRPGRVKTRLSPPLAAEQACELNACFLRDTIACLEQATLASPAEWLISYTPAGEEAAFSEILPPGSLLLSQRGDGFGERLLTTAQDLFSCGFAGVCLIDSDSPTVPTAAYIDAVRHLLAPVQRAVLGPSEDGGYYLLGIQRAHPELFAEIAWSTAAVARQTLERAASLPLRVELLPPWYDVDDAESLARLQEELLSSSGSSRGGYPAPHTQRFLQELRTSSPAVAAVGSLV